MSETHERDYLERTIATVRNHRDAENCWPSWANIFADEIERLWKVEEALADAEQTLSDVLGWDDGDGHPHPPSMFRLAKRHIRERHRRLNGQPTSIHDRILATPAETA